MKKKRTKPNFLEVEKLMEKTTQERRRQRVSSTPRPSVIPEQEPKGSVGTSTPIELPALLTPCQFTICLPAFKAFAWEEIAWTN